MTSRLSPISRSVPQVMVSAALTVETGGPGFTDITRDVRAFLRDAGAAAGMLLAYLRHTSASLVIQENADPDVQTDLMTALERLAPRNAGWIHGSEGPDDMPAHVKSMLNGVSVAIPVEDGAPVLGTWQGIYLVEHRTAPHRREVALQFIGTAK
ncbi:MAG: secondary thiamine-phosphate synthase enzyme YjbQ [Xanthobacteraceae bacterium]|jgi:secondary thiamine-phosphate synthase enzyme|uniref:secondary thiamine-phosphate synthase enzyme YjbQ n=1 Tax=Pseudolabrys sp. TaxID=1960880 RepID=UPI003D0A25D9